MVDHHTLRTFDHYSAEHNNRMYEVMEFARQHCPVAFTESVPGYWIVTRYEDAKRVLLDTDTFSSTGGATVFPRNPDLPPDIPLGLDPPEHREYRGLLSRFFTRDAVRPWVPRLREIATDTLADVLPRGRMEVVRDFAAPYAFACFAEAFLRVEDPALLHDFIAAADRVVVENTEESYGGLMALVLQLIERRHVSGVESDDFISALEQGTVGGEPVPPERVASCVCSLVAAGFETNVTQLTTILLMVSRQPELADRISGPDWARHHLDEFLRYSTPVAGLPRTATTDTTIGDTEIRKGDKVIAHLASADRDAEKFPDGDRLDFGRAGVSAHLAFGAGVHRCLGAIFAEAVIGAGLDELTKRAKNFALAGEVSYTGGIVRRPKEVHVTFEAVP